MQSIGSILKGSVNSLMEPQSKPTGYRGSIPPKVEVRPTKEKITIELPVGHMKQLRSIADEDLLTIEEQIEVAIGFFLELEMEGRDV